MGDINLQIGGGTALLGWQQPGVASVLQAKTFNATVDAAPLAVDVAVRATAKIIPGSLRFTLGGLTFIDRNGTLYSDVSNETGAGIASGTIDYETGLAQITRWSAPGGVSVAVSSGLGAVGQFAENGFRFRVPGSPLRPGSFYFQVTTDDGRLISATANDSGVLSGPEISGAVDQDSGVVRITLGRTVAAAGLENEPWFDPDDVVAGQIFKPTFVIPSTLRYNAVVLSNLPLNADILGLDPVRLPMDGRVPIYRPADVVVIHNTKATALPNPVTAGQTYSAGRADLSEMWIEDSTGKRVEGAYVADLDAGSVTIAADFTGAGLTQPLKIKHRIEDMALATDIQINGQITLASPLPRAYDDDSYLSSALLFGDMAARATNVHDLLTFTSWSDTPGTQANAQYNNIDYPVEVLNNGAVTERWRINFTNTTGFQVIGENVGVIATGTTAEDCSPTNALTGLPYFVIRAAGWGSGWSAGNNLRFNTVSAAAPIWIARTILPGATLSGDSFSLQLRGDVDAE